MDLAFNEILTYFPVMVEIGDIFGMINCISAMRPLYREEERKRREIRFLMLQLMEKQTKIEASLRSKLFDDSVPRDMDMKMGPLYEE